MDAASFLSVKGIAADKLTHQTGRRNLIIHIRFLYKVQNFDNRTNFIIAFVLRLNGRQQGENMLLQYRQLIQGGAVENHIRMLLIRENPPLLASADTVPHGKGTLYGRAPGFKVVSETATFAYKVDNVYSPQEEVTISYNDETIGINWPIDNMEIKLSEKDKHGIKFIDAEHF